MCVLIVFSLGKVLIFDPVTVAFIPFSRSYLTKPVWRYRSYLVQSCHISTMSPDFLCSSFATVSEVAGHDAIQADYTRLH